MNLKIRDYVQSISEKLRWKTVISFSGISLCGIALAGTAVHIHCLLVKVSRVLGCVTIAKECET